VTGEPGELGAQLAVLRDAFPGYRFRRRNFRGVPCYVAEARCAGDAPLAAARSPEILADMLAGQAASRGKLPQGQADSRGKLPQGSRASSLAATSVRSSPTTSGGANGAPKPPDLRLTQPVVSPARLAP